MQPARRPCRARSRRLLAPRDHDRVGELRHRSQGRLVECRRLLHRVAARPRRGVAAPPRRRGASPSRPMRRPFPTRSRPSSPRSASPTPTKVPPRSTRGASPSPSSKRSRSTNTVSRNRSTRWAGSCASRRRWRSNIRRCPGIPPTPDIDRLLLAIRLRPDDFEVIAREVDDELERIADMLGVEA